jgi:multidrug efflux system outer membrane protein
VRVYLPLVGATLLAGCVSGPDYKVPDRAMVSAPAAQAPFRSGAERAFSQAELPEHWWRLYDDPRLDGYVTEAIAANTDLRAADANLRRATYVLREVQAGRTVQTGISAGAGEQRAGLPAPGTAFSYSLGFDVSYPLDLAGGIRRAIESAGADAEAVRAARDQVRVTVAAAVARSYAAACSANVTLAATRRVLDIQRQSLNVEQRLQRGGRGTAFDVTRARTAVDQSAASLPAIVAERQAELYRLGALLGRAPADYPREVEACQQPPALKALLPIGDGQALLRRRPDIRQSERNLAAATAQIGVATAQLYPQVSLGGSVGTAGPIRLLANRDTFSASIGPLVSWSWPNRSIARARIGQAGAAADAAAAQFDGTVIEALRQTETALSAYAREIDRNRALAAARDDADRATAQANRLFRFGRTGFLDVLTAQASLATAEATLAQSKATLIDRQVDVFLALGGGWES